IWPRTALPSGVFGEGTAVATSTAYLANGDEKRVASAWSTAVASLPRTVAETSSSVPRRAAKGASTATTASQAARIHRRCPTTWSAIRQTGDPEAGAGPSIGRDPV